MIYAVQRPDGVIKIGYTSRALTQRMRELRCAVGGEVSLLVFMEGGRADERALHKRFAAHLVDGREWFLPAPEVLEWAAAAGVIPDPLKAYHFQLDKDVYAKLLELCEAYGLSPKAMVIRLIEERHAEYVAAGKLAA